MGSLLKELPSSEMVATIEQLGSHKVGVKDLDRLRAYPAILEKVATFIKNGGYESGIHTSIAQEILGENFSSPQDMGKIYGVYNIIEEKSLVEEKFPWGFDVLYAPCPFIPYKKVWQTHFAFLGFHHLNLRSATINSTFRMLFEHPYYIGTLGLQKYPDEEGERLFDESWTYEDARKLGWRLVAPANITDLATLSYSEQICRTPAGYSTLTPVEEIMCNLCYRCKKGIDPHSFLSRTSATANDGRNICISLQGRTVIFKAMAFDTKSVHLGMSLQRIAL